MSEVRVRQRRQHGRCHASCTGTRRKTVCLCGTVHYAVDRPLETLSHYSDPGSREQGEPTGLAKAAMLLPTASLNMPVTSPREAEAMPA